MNMENQYNYYNSEDPMNNYQNNFENNNQGQENPDNGENKGGKKKMKKGAKAVTVAGFAILFGVVASATFLTSNIVGNKLLGLNETSSSSSSGSSSSSSSSEISTATLTTSSSSVTSDVSSVVEAVMPSVVSITNMSVQEVQNYFGGATEETSESAGSGIIISQTDDELLIVTNYHVIEGNDTLTVTFSDESSAEANVKGTDSDSDLAVIAVSLDDLSDDTKDAIAIATLGDSTELKVGEPVIAIGNALGYGQSVTTGVVSALNREATTTTDSETGETTSTSSDVKLIQTDAAINPGNSGGALLNMNGEVIGINSSKLAGTTVEGMGYAIQISDVKDIISDLMNQETKTKVDESERGYIGISGYDVTSESAERYNMPTGVYIAEVASGGGAEAAGISTGSIVTGINGTTVESMEELQEQLEYYAVGDTVELTVAVPQTSGEYEESTVEVTLGSAS